MAEQLTFTSVELDKLGRNNKGAWGTFSASLNQSVIKKMGWADIPECFTGSDLEGEIAAISLELTPDDSGRKSIELEQALIVEFKTVRRELEGKQGKGHRTELRFRVVCQDMKGAGKLEAYKMSNLGKSKLRVSYEKAAVQADLPGTEEDTGCVACNAGIPLAEGSTKKHMSGARCTRTAVQETLAN